MSATLADRDATDLAAISAALNGADPESAIESAYVRIADAGDLPVLLAMIRAMVRIGLSGLALRVLNAVDGLLADPQLAGLAQQLSRLPSGEIPAATLRSRYAERRAVLVRTVPSLSSLPSSLPERLHVFRSIKGNHQIVRDRADRKIDLVVPLADHAARAASIALPPFTPTSSFSLLGTPTPQLFARLLTQRDPAGYAATIDVLESDVELFSIWLALLDDASDLVSGRVTCLVGDDLVNRYRLFLADHPWRAPASHTITNRRPGWTPPAIDTAFYAPLHAAMRSKQDRLTELLRCRYAQRSVGWWKHRYAEATSGGTPLRLLGFTTRFSSVIQHAMGDLAAAFRRRGCTFELVKEANEHVPTVDIRSALAAAECDGVVVINHLRCEFQDAIPANLPYVCWMQDHMDRLCSKDAGASVGALDLVVTHAPHVLESLYGYPIARCIGTNNLTDAETYSNVRLPESELEPHRCDVSFVSHGSESPEELLALICAGTPAEFTRLCQAFLGLIRTQLASDGWLNSQHLVERMLEAEATVRLTPLTPEFRRSRIYPQLARIYDRVYRHEAIAWTAAWARQRGRRFRLYGSGWVRHPEFSQFAAGQVANGRELRAVYQASAISLQVNGYSSLHQRLLDGLACGGCMLSRWNPADFLRAPFLRIRERIEERCFTSLAELVRHREEDAAFDVACCEAERLVSVQIRLLGDPRRAAHVAVLRAGNDIPELRTDTGLFETLRDMRLLPERVAADLPGFERSTFRNAAQLHTLLDQLLEDPRARRALCEPMRASVLQHDTYDGLVERMLMAFGGAGRPRQGSAA